MISDIQVQCRLKDFFEVRVAPITRRKCNRTPGYFGIPDILTDRPDKNRGKLVSTPNLRGQKVKWQPSAPDGSDNESRELKSLLLKTLTVKSLN